MQKPVRTQTRTHDGAATHELPAYFRGRQEYAGYVDTKVWRYAGNPLIEALGQILSEKEAAKQLAYYPPYSENERKLPPQIREHLTHTLLDLFVSLPAHIDLERRISCLLRSGYVPRNPLAQDYCKQISTIAKDWDRAPLRANPMCSTATGFNIIGISGGGKTKGVQKVVDLNPQVIFHNNFNNRAFTFCQIVWLLMSCPHDGSTRGLCLDFFRIIDDLVGTNHYERYAQGRRTTDEMLPGMARVAAVHGLGALLIDEIQFLSESSSGGRVRMLNFFCDLTNRINLPVVFVGTYKALEMLRAEFRQVRRGLGEGEKRWERLADEKTWRYFLKSTWRYQYTSHVTPVTDELCELFFDLTQGIPDLCVKLYMLSQIRAIRTGIEAITPAVVRSVARDCFASAEPVLNALRTNDLSKLELCGDVHLSDVDECIRALDKAADSSSLISPDREKSRKRPNRKPCKSNAVQADPSALKAKHASDSASEEPAANGGSQGSNLSGDGKEQSGYDKLKRMGYIRPGTEFLNIDRAT